MSPAWPGALPAVLCSSSRRGLVAALGGAIVAVLALSLPSAAFAAPVAQFTVAPPTPVQGQRVTFRSTSTDPAGPILTADWDFDGDGIVDASGPRVTTTYATPGARTVTLHVTAADGTADATRTVTVLGPNAPPRASFNIVPPVVSVGSAAAFVSTSSDADGTIVRAEWDFNNDGRFTDAVGNIVQHAFRTPGAQVVHLRVTDDRGGQQVADGVITVAAVVANVPPLASFTVSPQRVVAGAPVTFTSQSTDPDGQITALAWDLNGDGAFTDAAGATAQTVFPAPGTYKVALQATDSARVSSVAFQSIVVVARAAPPSFIHPFPVVRLRGLVQSHAVLIRRLTITAPRGAHLRVRCRGRGCGRKRHILVVAKSKGKTMRVRSIERHLFPGARLEVYVTQPGLIGKYTRFFVARRGAPHRRDRCVQPGAVAPSVCP